MGPRVNGEWAMETKTDHRPDVRSVVCLFGRGAIPGRSPQRGSSAVSYTHLDVYKRQSENNVVSVEGDGLECTLTAKSLGSATIIATVEGEKVASGTVTVVPTAPGVVSIRVSQDEVTISSGETYTINATVEMEKADMTPATIKWSSNNTSVAEVDSEGVITAREVGNAIIKGVAGEKTVEIAVEVVENPNSTPHDSTQDAGREPEEGQDATKMCIRDRQRTFPWERPLFFWKKEG